jgi:putative phosphoesterase
MPTPERIVGKSGGEPVVLAVLSDTHGDDAAIHIASGMPDGARPDALIHLGDMEDAGWIQDVSRRIPVFAVAGNRDPWNAGLPGFRLIEAGGLRFACVHGHVQQVKASLFALVCLAEDLDADVVLFGHTHGYSLERRSTSTGRPILLLNPGSARGFGRVSSSGYLTITVTGRSMSIRRSAAHGTHIEDIRLD